MTKTVRLLGVIFSLGILLSSMSPTVKAQEYPLPWQENAFSAPTGAWRDSTIRPGMVYDDISRLAQADPLATSGPDEFGYTLDDSVPLSWIDATDGVNTGLKGSSNPAAKQVSLPFAFKFYENTYTSLYIASHGYIAFENAPSWPDKLLLPSISPPNNLIAPFAAHFDLAEIGSVNQVYYESGGSSPNRYFVAEWYQVESDESTLTFEVILYENGDFVFQYNEVLPGETLIYCGSMGIEDSIGMDGLVFLPSNCLAQSFMAVRFTRPAPVARIRAVPLLQGHFTGGGDTVSFPMTIWNNGDAGSDIYDLGVTSTWPVSIISSASGLALVDTDGDGAIDTGNMAMASSMIVLVKVQTPSVANVGDYNIVSISATSSLDTTKHKISTFQTAVPAPFAQIFRDSANGALSLDLIQPNSETVKRVTPDNFGGSHFSVIEMMDGFINFWCYPRLFGPLPYNDLEYTLVDYTGKSVLEMSKLTSNSSAVVDTIDYSPTMATAPNGRIGVVWNREIYDGSTGESQHNIFYSILDSAGNIVYGPTNLTNNTGWGWFSTPGVPRFTLTHIAASGDNRFTIAWIRADTVNTTHTENVFFTVKDSDGGPVIPITNATIDFPNATRYFNSLVLASLTNNQVMLAWTVYDYSSPLSTLTVRDSGGNLVYASGELNLGENVADIEQLSTGPILIAISDFSQIIQYAIMDGGSFNLVVDPTILDNSVSLERNISVSVTSDLAGHGILTWTDSDDRGKRRNLFYALVDSDGSVITQPMIFKSGTGIDPLIETNGGGFGNTTYHLVAPTSQNVDLRIEPARLINAPQDDQVTIPVIVGNYGAGEATQIVLSATLDGNLSFVGAEPAPTSVIGNIVTWDLVDMNFLANGQAFLQVAIPPNAVQSNYTIHWTLGSAGPEANPVDNSANTRIIDPFKLFLPAIVGKN